MFDVVYCKDCAYATAWRSGEIAEKYGKGLECSKNIISCPDDYDYCSYGIKKIKCPKCGKVFSKTEILNMNFCYICGANLKE